MSLEACPVCGYALPTSRPVCRHCPATPPPAAAAPGDSGKLTEIRPMNVLLVLVITSWVLYFLS